MGMGAQIKVPVIGADIYDNFPAANGTTLAGTVTVAGAKTWGSATASGANTAVQVQSHMVRAVSGSGNRAVMINPGQADTTIIARIGALAANPVPSIIVRAASVDDNFSINLRTGGTGSEYALYRRTAGAQGSPLISTGIAPAGNDLIRIDVAGATLTAYRNGVLLLTYTMTALLTSFNAGFNMNGSDLVTAFSEFGIYYPVAA